jgi:peptidoglycan/LPS O-acetylase OafA/YrhL
MNSMPYRPLGTFRLLLAIMVVAQHYSDWCFRGPVPDLVMRVLPGTTAVYVFFVISGFVIIEAVECVYRNRPISFVTNRFLRIVPLYLICLSLCFAAFAALGIRPDLLTLHNFVGNAAVILPMPGRWAFPQDVPVFVLAWSLSFELAFYFAIACFLAMPSSMFRGALLVAAVLVSSLALYDVAKGRLWFTFINGAPFFACGGSYYFALQGSRLARVVSPAFLCGCLFFLGHLWPLFLILIGAGAILASRTAKTNRTDRFLGELSYPLYLGHWVPLAPFFI